MHPGLVASIQRRGRFIVDFEYQDEVGKIGTDYARCRETRKSTSGGIIRIGTKSIKRFKNKLICKNT